MNYATRFRIMLAARGMSPDELGLKLRVQTYYLSWIETGGEVPMADMDSRIREALSWTERDDAALEMLAEPQPEGRCRHDQSWPVRLAEAALRDAPRR